MLFHAIDKQAVIRNVKSGVYKQVGLYERDGELFAGTCGGFIRLMLDGRTSSPNTKWDAVEAVWEAPNRVGGGLRAVTQTQLRSVA
jgi:hypothetical protein